jgi:BirA family biotin operon repressor/biotin-[acetyl-CoA-carboxylase] ligase
MFTGMTGTSASYAVAGTRFTVRWVPETGSTNADLLAAARAGEREGSVLVADHQTAGRGRLDRRWEAPAGAGLLFSVLLRPACSAEDLHLVTNALGLATAEAIEANWGVPAGLKWPNDLVARLGGSEGDDERKLAGILAESVVEVGTVAAVVVGMGINVAWGDAGGLPEEIRSIGVALDQLGAHVERRPLLDAVLQRFDHRYGQVADRAERDHLLADYRARCVTLDRLVRVERADGDLTGRAVDIGPGGELVVDPGDGRAPVTVAVGDVIHVR